MSQKKIHTKKKNKRRGTISPSLIMKREKVHESSLIGPSGFLLGWLEMYGKELEN